jgi:hypothetical protein
MPLETAPPITPPNAAYIADLNPDWPTGADFPSDGDDHIRGVKNVLKQTFPNLTGPVTLTQDEINSGSKLLEADTVCLFYQATAPTGWTRVNPTVGNRMIIITSGGAGVEDGDDDPILNNKVPSHTHDVVGDTETQSDDHAHSVTLDGGNHQHTYRASRTPVSLYIASGGGSWTLVNGNRLSDAYSTDAGGGHTHSGTTGANNADHVHSVDFTSQANAGAANWAPRYTACLLAKRDEWTDPAP